MKIEIKANLYTLNKRIFFQKSIDDSNNVHKEEKIILKTFIHSRHDKFWTKINLMKSFKTQQKIKKVLQTFKPLKR